jgi:protein-disulfide isomerase-like protein with CxxC motif
MLPASHGPPSGAVNTSSPGCFSPTGSANRAAAWGDSRIDREPASIKAIAAKHYIESRHQITSTQVYAAICQALGLMESWLAGF